MKKLYNFITAMMFLVAYTVSGQCPTDYVTLTTQAEVNAFAANYPDCTHIPGALSISGSDISDLSPLSNITGIEGRLYIASTQLQSLAGLENLASIGGDLYIAQNTSLTDISDLSNIDPTTITGSYGLYIVSNPALSVCNLPNFCTYTSYPANTHPRTISGNAGNCLNETAMAISCSQECPGNITLHSQAEVNAFAVNFPDCTEISGTLYIGGSNSNITNLSPLSNITSVGNLTVGNNVQLLNLDDISNITSVGGSITISNNSKLQNINGLSNLTGVGIRIDVSSNPKLQNINGFSNLASIGESLVIYDNALLQNLTGLNNLSSIGAALVIINNAKIQNLNSLSNLTGIGGELQISDNNLLTDISGIANIDPTTISGYSGLYITDNPVLSVCNLPNLCSYIANPTSTHPRTISDNAGDCITEWAMAVDCLQECPAGDVILHSQAELNAFVATFPNCTEIVGNLYIGNNYTPDYWNYPGSNITSLSGLSNITSVAGRVTLEYNRQLNNLNGLSNLTSIGGDFILRENDHLQNFNALGNLESIGGSFEVSYSNALQNFNGLSSLTDIGGGLSIELNTHLQNLSGLSALTTIGGSLKFYGNDILQNLNGLTALTSIGGLSISNNQALQNLSSLNNVTTINGNVNISYNDHLQNLDGLSNVTSINGQLQVTGNNLLTDISGLANIDPATIDGQYGLEIVNNPVLSVCNLSNLCTYLSYPLSSHPRNIGGNASECINEVAMASACDIPCLTGNLTLRTQAEVNAFGTNFPDCTEVPGNLTIGYQDGSSSYSNITDLSPLSNITTIGGNLYISRNSQLQNLEGLNNLTNVGSFFYLLRNAQLQNTDGLSNLTNIGGYLYIIQNTSLTDISGLSNIDPATITGGYGLLISGNSVLSVCDMPNFCSYLSYPSDTHPRTINNNAGDCISEAAVALACDTGDFPYNETQEEYGDTIQEAVALSDCDVESVVIIPPGNYGTETVDATDPCYDILFKIGVSPGSAFIGSFLVDDSDTVEIEIGGASTLDKYVILNTLSLGNATLDIKFINDFLPVQGDSWIIFDNTFSGAVNGTFAGLNENAVFTAEGYQFQVSYTGGDGNDIIVTVTDCPEISIDNLPENQEADIVAGTCQAIFGWVEPSFDGGCGNLAVTRTISPQPELPPISYGPGNNVAAGIRNGVTTVTYTVTDEMGSTEDYSFTLTAHDVEAPEITCPGNITVDNDSGVCGAEVTFEVPMVAETPCNLTSPKHLANNSEVVGSALDCTGVVSQHLQIYDLAAEGVETDYQLNNVTVGIFHSDGSLSYLSVNLYFEDQLTEPFTSYSGPISDTVTPFASTTMYMPPGDNYLFNVPLSVFIPAGSKVYVEVVTSLYSDYLLGYSMDGSNTTQGYISCGDDSYASLEFLGYPDASPIISLDGEEYNVLTPVQTGGLPSGSVFPVGTTTNTFEVTSANGITSSCSFDVIVEDHEAPVITCPVPDIFYGTDEDECSASLSFTAMATDNCSAEVTYSLDEEETQPIVFPYIFPLGTTTVYATATDPSGNKAQCEFDVTIVTSQLPEIICTDNQLAEVDADMCTYTHNGTDWDAAVALDCNIASITYELTGATTGTGTSLDGVEFNSGETTVTWTVTDNENNTDTCSFTVTVEDNIAPEITCIANQSADVDADECSYTHSGTGWDAQATDNCSIATINYELTGATTGNGTSLDGVEFNLGETTITWTVTDNAGNTNTCSFTVTVEDTIAPEITCASNQSVDVDAAECSYTHSGTAWDAVATDNCSIATVNYELTGATTGNGISLDGVEFNLGETTVTWTVTDNAGNTNTCSFTVTVEDNIAPEITCAPNQSVDVDADECSYTHSGTAWDAVATDNCSIATVNYELSGATTGTGTSLDGVVFNLGETTVTWAVTDNAGNTNSCSFTVTVEDNIAPVAVCVDSFTVELDENGQATITAEDIDNGSFDSCGDVSLEISQSSFDCSDIGENAIILTVTDSHGNTSSCTTTVTVEDNIAPEIFCPDDLTINVPVGETYLVPDYFADGDASATDNCSVSVSQSPEAGTELEAGTHTVTLTAVDQSGNEVSCSFDVEVQMGVTSYNMKSLVMYPNPARSTVTIGNPQAMNIVKVDVYDLQGRLVYHITPKDGHSDVTLDVSGLASGTYLVSISNDKGDQITKKLLKR